VECGALIGLRNLLAATDASQQPDSGQAPVADAGELVASAVIHHGAVDTIPYQQLMPAIVHFQARSRRR
jgi:hypothetical protein